MHPENVSPVDPILSNCSSPSTVSQCGKKNRNKYPSIQPMTKNGIKENVPNNNSCPQQQPRTNGNSFNQRRGTVNHNRDNHAYYHSTQTPSKAS